MTRDYLINGEYKKIKGTIFLGYNARSTNSKYLFRVWGDGKLLYTSENIIAGYLPQDFNVDISGVKVLKLGFERTYGILESASLGISGATLYKN